MTQSGDLDRDRMALQSFLLGRPGAEAILEAQIRKVARQQFRSLAADTLEDIVQAVFLKLCVQVSKPDFQLHSSLNGLLRTLTRATCVDWYRRERRRVLTDWDPDEMCGSDPDPLECLVIKNRLERLRVGLDALDPRCRGLIRARFEARTPFAVLAEGFGRPEATVRGWHFNCLQRLRAIVERIEQGRSPLHPRSPKSRK